MYLYSYHVHSKSCVYSRILPTRPGSDAFLEMQFSSATGVSFLRLYPLLEKTCRLQIGTAIATSTMFYVVCANPGRPSNSMDILAYSGRFRQGRSKREFNITKRELGRERDRERKESLHPSRPSSAMSFSMLLVENLSRRKAKAVRVGGLKDPHARFITVSSPQPTC